MEYCAKMILESIAYLNPASTWLAIRSRYFSLRFVIVAKAKLRIILLAIKFMPYNLLSFISQAFIHCGLNSLALKRCTIHFATKHKTI